MNNKIVVMIVAPLLVLLAGGWLFNPFNGSEDTLTENTNKEINSRKNDSSVLENTENVSQLTEKKDGLLEKESLSQPKNTNKKVLVIDGSDTRQSVKSPNKTEKNEELVILGLHLTKDTSQFEISDYENEIGKIEEYISTNSVVDKLNSLDISEEELPQYVELIEHLTSLRAENLQKQASIFQQKVDEYVQVHPSLVQRYKQGEFHDLEKYNAQKAQAGVDEINEKFDEERKQYELEDAANLEKGETLNEQLNSDSKGT